MTKRSKAQQAVQAAVAITIATIGDLAKALAGITADAARVLTTASFGGMYRTTSGGHVNKRGLFIAAIIDTLNGDGTFDTLKARLAAYSVPAFRAEVQYAVATGDVAYFTNKGKWCAWARPLLKGDALDPDVTDASLAQAFAITCPPMPDNVGGMLAEITLAAQRRNVTPLPVFADPTRTNRVAYFDAETHGADGYRSKGYGSGLFVAK